MNRPELKHLRRLVAWVRCEIGQSPEDLRATMQGLSAVGIGPSDDAARQRLVETHDRARAVPKYVRAAVKALEKYTGDAAGVVDAQAREVGRVSE